MIEEAFWSRVNKTYFCWEWTGWKSERGYGLISTGGKKYARAHRIAWETGDPMTVDKFKTGAEAAKVVLDILTTLVDRDEKKKAQEKRIADLEAEVERLKGEKK